jgi:carboxylesterase type B
MANDMAGAGKTQKPVVEITSGKLRGTSAAGVYAFKGVPYGASTAGRNRFMLPQPRNPGPANGTRLLMSATRHNRRTGRNAARNSTPSSVRRM